jgi:Domain of unknown function (DU1801)
VAELKTKATRASVTEFLNSIADDARRADCKSLVAMMTEATKAKPVMWGPAIIGFGDHEYTGANGKSNKWFQAGFSPRKQALTLYLMGGSDKQLLAKLGAHTTGASCLYVKRLEDVHGPTLQKLIANSVKRLRKREK